MVFFTCNHCGESVKKPSVEKHYNMKCRNPVFVSCMDCLKDFREDYAEHTRCITEAEKYSGKDYVAKDSKSSGLKKQESWLEIVRTILNTNEIELTEDVRGIFQKLQSYDNVPRKKVKFENFVANCMRVKKYQAEAVWKVLEKALEKFKAPRNIQKEECVNGHAADQVANSGSNNCENGSESPADHQSTTEVAVKEGKKKNKKQKHSCENNIEADLETTTEKKKKEKRKKTDEEQNGIPNELAEVNSNNYEVISGSAAANETQKEEVLNVRKKKNKKQKHSIEIEGNSEPQLEEQAKPKEDKDKNNGIVVEVNCCNEKEISDVAVENGESKEEALKAGKKKNKRRKLLSKTEAKCEDEPDAKKKKKEEKPMKTKDNTLETSSGGDNIANSTAIGNNLGIQSVLDENIAEGVDGSIIEKEHVPKKAKKKLRNQQPDEENERNVQPIEAVHGQEFEPSQKKKKLQDEETSPTGKEKFKVGNFDWTSTIFKVLGKNNNEISLGKLKEKVLKKYKGCHDLEETPPKLERTFNKKLRKSGLFIENDIVKTQI